MFVLAYDLGGTKIAAGIINSSGKILTSLRVPIVATQEKTAVLNQLVDLGKTVISNAPKSRQISRIGIASAGPLHAAKGVLLEPTNLSANQPGWERVPLVSILKQKLKRPVYLENDAAAALLAEHWRGALKRLQNSMILTLGTGLGTAVMIEGKLLRAGRGLHTEAGHLILNAQDSTAPCGCGNLGCAEAYLSGKNFANRFNTRHMHGKNQLLEENLIQAQAPKSTPQRSGATAAEIATRARTGDSEALQAFEEYAFYMAIAIHNYVVIYAPERVVLTGSFANASDLFLNQTENHLKNLLKRRRKGIDMMPQLLISKLQNQAGLLGGAYVALHQGRTA